MLTGLNSFIFQRDSKQVRGFTTEADTFVKTLDPQFKIEETIMFTEVAPKKIDTTKEKVEQADQKLQALSAESRKAQFQADSLALARDLAQVGNVYRDVVKSENSIRQERIMHLRGQNCIGAALVADYMSLNMAVRAGSLKEQISLADRAGDYQIQVSQRVGLVNNVGKLRCLIQFLLDYF